MNHPIRDLRRQMVRPNIMHERLPVRVQGMFWTLVSGAVLALAMASCHYGRQTDAARAYKGSPSADQMMVSGDYPIPRQDWNEQQEASISREYGKIAGVTR